MEKSVLRRVRRLVLLLSPWRVTREEDLLTGVAGLFVRLDDEVTEEGVVERGAGGASWVRLLTDVPRPRLAAGF